MDMEPSNNTIFYEIEKAIKAYRNFAQVNIDKSAYDITLNQLILLIQISKSPGSSQVELSDILFKDVASITRMIESLVKRNYLKRRENKIDRRRKELVLTPMGEKVIDDLTPVIKSNRKIALLGIEMNEIKSLSVSLNKIIDNTQLTEI